MPALKCSNSARQPGSALLQWLCHPNWNRLSNCAVTWSSAFRSSGLQVVSIPLSAQALLASEDRYVVVGSGKCRIDGDFRQRYGRRDLLCAVSLAREPEVAAAYRSRPGRCDLEINGSSTGQPGCCWLASLNVNSLVAAFPKIEIRLDPLMHLRFFRRPQPSPACTQLNIVKRTEVKPTKMLVTNAVESAFTVSMPKVKSCSIDISYPPSYSS